MKKLYSLFLGACLLLMSNINQAQTVGWEQTTDFPGSARANAVSFVIGDYAYVGTGKDGSTYYKDFYKFDPVNESWSPIADFPGEAREGAVAFVIEGKGYVGTGKGSSSFYNDFYVYDPLADTWAQVAVFPGNARVNAVAFATEGKGYVGTGRDLNYDYVSDFYAFDPVSNSWTASASLIRDNKRIGAAGFAINGKGYVACGFYFDGSMSIIISDIQEYDPASDSWILKVDADIKLSSKDGAAPFVLANQAYLVAGKGTDVVRYDPADNSLVTMEPMGPVSSDERFDPVAFGIGDKGYAGLGYYTPDFSTSTFNQDFWKYGEIVLPLAPSSLQVDQASITKTSASISWVDNASDETGYVIELSTGNNSSFALEASLAAGSTSYAFTNLQEGKRYYIRVYAVRGGIKSVFAEANFLTYSDKPLAPSDLKVVEGSVSDTSAALSWTDNANDEMSYVVELSEGNSLAYSIVAQLSAGSTTYELNGLKAGTAYFARVAAVKNGIASDYTYTATSFTTLTGKPNPPAELSVFPSEGRSIGFKLKWLNDQSIRTGSVIERSLDGNGFQPIDTIGSSYSEYFDDMDLSSYKEVAYRVLAINNQFISDPSNEVSIKTELLRPIVDSLDYEVYANSHYSFIAKMSLYTKRVIGEDALPQISLNGSPFTNYGDTTYLERINFYFDELDTVRMRVVVFNKYGSDTSETVATGPHVLSPGSFKLRHTSAEAVGFMYSQGNADKKTMVVERSTNDSDFVVIDSISGSEYVKVNNINSSAYVYYDTTVEAGNTYSYRAFNVYNGIRSATVDIIELDAINNGNWKRLQGHPALDSTLTALDENSIYVENKVYHEGSIYLLSAGRKVFLAYNLDTKKVVQLPDFPGDNYYNLYLFDATGNYLVVAGGGLYGEDQNLERASTLWVFNLTTLEWSTAISYPAGLGNNRANDFEYVEDEKVYLSGANDQGNTVLGIYDIATNQWQTLVGAENGEFHGRLAISSTDSITFYAQNVRTCQNI